VRRTIASGAILACFLLQCGCVKYQPHALNPVQSEAALRARTAPAELNAETLTSTALRYSGDLEVARAKVAAAEAAVVTAGQRINPSLSAEGGYNRTPESAATYSFAPAFTIETAGKRGYRILAAQKSAEAARIELTETEWRVRSRVRAALVGYRFAQRRDDALADEAAAHREIVGIFEKRVALGEASNPELSAARAEQLSMETNLQTAEGDLQHGLAEIAAAAGFPVSALEGRALALQVFDVPPGLDSLPLKQVQRDGLLHRADVRRTLVEYEAADAHLRLELANQYPNITLSPAYTFQEGFPAYVLGAAVESLPVLHRHQGPIGEAEAARREVEARFNALQALAIAETETALRQYGASVTQWTSFEKVEAAQVSREASVLSLLRAGETDRLDTVQAHLAALAARRVTLEAMERAEVALGTLEDAVQSVLGPEAKN
jgi:outer membrane protein, heavy metal efflux system